MDGIVGAREVEEEDVAERRGVLLVPVKRRGPEVEIVRRHEVLLGIVAPSHEVLLVAEEAIDPLRGALLVIEEEEIDPPPEVLLVIEVEVIVPPPEVPLVAEKEKCVAGNVGIVRLREARLDTVRGDIKAAISPTKLKEPQNGSSEGQETVRCTAQDHDGKRKILPTWNFDLILHPTNAARRRIDPTLRMLPEK